MNGYMRASAPSKEMEEWYLNLSTRLESLAPGANYSLLTLASNTIALFRDSSGRYGIFDPHSRTPEGFACLNGTAIMLTFKHLGEMIDRIHTMFSDVSDVSSYDFMPLSFQSVISSANDNQDIHVSNSQSPAIVQDTSNPQMLFINCEEPSTFNPLKKLSKEKRIKTMRKQREQQRNESRRQKCRQKYADYTFKQQEKKLGSAKYKCRKENKLLHDRNKYANCLLYRIKKQQDRKSVV